MNLRHPAPKAGALPGCATPRIYKFYDILNLVVFFLIISVMPSGPRNRVNSTKGFCSCYFQKPKFPITGCAPDKSGLITTRDFPLFAPKVQVSLNTPRSNCRDWGTWFRKPKPFSQSFIPCVSTLPRLQS